MKESSLALEQSVAVSQAKVCSLQSELDSNGDKINRLESELDLESKRRVSAENAAGDASSLQTRLEALRVTHEECANALASARRELSETAAGAAGAYTKATEKEHAAKTLEERCAMLTSLLKSKDAELKQASVVRRALHNQVQELKGNIRVFCRVRPACGDETVTGTTQGGGLNLDQSLLSVPKLGEKAGTVISLAPPGKDKPFAFTYDKVFDATCTQSEVFEDVEHLVRSALDGYKVRPRISQIIDSLFYRSW